MPLLLADVANHVFATFRLFFRSRLRLDLADLGLELGDLDVLLLVLLLEIRNALLCSLRVFLGDTGRTASSIANTTSVSKMRVQVVTGWLG